jgi:hypothetical protein
LTGVWHGRRTVIFISIYLRFPISPLKTEGGLRLWACI